MAFKFCKECGAETELNENGSCQDCVTRYRDYLVETIKKKKMDILFEIYKEIINKKNPTYKEVNLLEKGLFLYKE